jgi:hypothetical protein
MKHRILKQAAFAVALAGVFVVASSLLFIRTSEADKEPTWGVDFSDSQAKYLGLNPTEVYDATIHDLGATHIKIHVNWDAVEKSKGSYNFTSLDHQVAEAEKNNVKLIIVVGMKIGRWPECHTPSWFDAVPATERQAAITEYTKTLVNRYKDSSAVQYWQVENEPFLKFGTCSAWYYEHNTEIVEAEIATIRQIDSNRSIVVSESGELSDWTDAAKTGDIVGVTMYRSTWNKTTATFGLNPYTFLTPEYYAAKAAYIKHTYHKPVISIELQAEPWTAKSLTESSLDIQKQSMNIDLFKENVQFAREVRLDAYYFWGVEWWYWMKTKHNQPEIWNAAKEVFKN